MKSFTFIYFKIWCKRDTSQNIDGIFCLPSRSVMESSNASGGKWVMPITMCAPAKIRRCSCIRFPTDSAGNSCALDQRPPLLSDRTRGWQAILSLATISDVTLGLSVCAAFAWTVFPNRREAQSSLWLHTGLGKSNCEEVQCALKVPCKMFYYFISKIDLVLTNSLCDSYRHLHLPKSIAINLFLFYA